MTASKVVLAVLMFFIGDKTHSQTTSQCSDAGFGVKLSIRLINGGVTAGSTLFLHCLSKNFQQIMFDSFKLISGACMKCLW